MRRIMISCLLSVLLCLCACGGGALPAETTAVPETTLPPPPPLDLSQGYTIVRPEMGEAIEIDAAIRLHKAMLERGAAVDLGTDWVKKETDIVKSVNQIEIFDTVVALLAGMMIVPAVYTFMGTEGMSAGPSLMFISLPKVFEAMGAVGTVVGVAFFVMVAFAALTSSVSVMEAVVSSVIDKWHVSRSKATLSVGAYALIAGVIVCLGYNLLYFELRLPNDSVGQILDVMDYISNYVLMPVVALASCVMVGWVLGPKSIIDEVTRNGERFGREKLYVAMIKIVAPVLLLFLLLQSLGVVKL